ncbi:hypothetical protein BCR33DRAFT_721630 [Rhizoclosmatium globosum]|uniref:Uncharacterized protein n=1 Tax=Rhizoclosmatium globosum TaxID=329046 RepID=A0A1Y2BRA0_9FUNG|nr:hypothetical protein BCR33DRAFT_721630 [Rhizoclosmatium globosum]|eukprot:ORY37279.1 hypothetical protein BCR33DRAFT_721630 [Rhizoclosmatium globosum]
MTQYSSLGPAAPLPLQMRAGGDSHRYDPVFQLGSCSPPSASDEGRGKLAQI